MELSNSHKISQEKRDFKISDVLITAWSRVQVLAGPPQKRAPIGVLFFVASQDLNKAATRSDASKAPVGLYLACGSQRIGMSKGVGCRSEGRQDLNPKLIKFSLRNPCSHDMIKPAWRRISCRIQITNSCPSLFRYIK